MKNYLTLILLVCFFSSKAQEEKIIKLQTIKVGLSEKKFTISGNGLLTNLTRIDPSRYNGEFIESSAVVNDDNSFTVYTKEKVNELLEQQRKLLLERTDSLKVYIKTLIDSLPKTTFVTMIQEQIEESILDKLLKAYIIPQNQEIALLREENIALKKELDDIKKKGKN
jgi:hypothetical protein